MVSDIKAAFLFGVVVLGICYLLTGCAGRSARTDCLASVPVNILVEKEKIDLSNIKDWNCK